MIPAPVRLYMPQTPQRQAKDHEHARCAALGHCRAAGLRIREQGASRLQRRLSGVLRTIWPGAANFGLSHDRTHAIGQRRPEFGTSRCRWWEPSTASQPHGGQGAAKAVRSLIFRLPDSPTIPHRRGVRQAPPVDLPTQVSPGIEHRCLIFVVIFRWRVRLLSSWSLPFW